MYQPVSSQPQPNQPPPPYAGTYTYTYGEQPTPTEDYGGPPEEDTFSNFGEKAIRAAFIRKVYSILCAQLLVSIGIVCLFVFHEPTKLYTRRHPGLFYAAWAVTFVVMIVIACVEKARSGILCMLLGKASVTALYRRRFPWNFGLLVLFTLCEGYLLGAISAFYRKDEVLMAMGIVAVFSVNAFSFIERPGVKRMLPTLTVSSKILVVSFAITVFAFQTKYDFTMMGGCLFVALIVLLCFGFLTIFFYSRIMSLIYACLGALIFAMYLVFDTQIMIGGGKAYSISPEEYIFAALNLYVDIVTLFIYILSIIGIARSD